MSAQNSFSSILLTLYRSLFLRIIFIVIVLVCLAYYTLVLPWINKAISQNYQEQTGHQLQHDQLNVHLLACNVDLDHLKDSAGLWQVDAVHMDVACWQSFRDRNLVVNSIVVNQLKISLQQFDDGKWNFDDVIQHLAHAAKTAAQKKSSDGTNPLFIKKLTLKNATLNSNVVALGNMQMAITPFSLDVSNIDLRTHNAINFSLDATINKSVPLKASGRFNLNSLDGELDVSAHSIPFIWFNSVLKPYVALDVLNGAIEFNNHVVLVKGVPQHITSNGKLTDLKLRPTTMEQDAVKWKSLEWENADILLDEKLLHIPLLILNQLDSQFIITKDRTTNIQAMILKPVAVEPLQANPVTVDSINQPWQFNIDRLAVNNAAIGFYDQSLVPSFMVIVQQFSGEVSDISSDPQKTTNIHLAGNVDGYSPVNLDAKAKFFLPQPQLEALFSFTQMDMGALSPYSAEYAGWRIKKGLLSVNLDYHYDQGKIVGKNHVVIDHLVFGEKVRSTHIVDVPLRLGLSLLTDQNGIAVLDADITGEPNNPSFDIKETLWRAFRNTLKKIITFPFNALSSLVNTKEDLGRIQFTPGESQLTELAIKKITLLQEALLKRPHIRLTIQGRYDVKADFIALQAEQVNSALQKEGLSRDDINAKNNAWEKMIAEKYKAKNLPNPTVTPQQKFDELAALEVVDPERFVRLAHERAQAVKQYFVLKLNVASDILFLDSETRCGQTNQCTSSEVVFTLED